MGVVVKCTLSRMVPTFMHVNHWSGVDYVLAKYHSN